MADKTAKNLLAGTEDELLQSFVRVGLNSDDDNQPHVSNVGGAGYNARELVRQASDQSDKSDKNSPKKPRGLFGFVAKKFSKFI